MGVINLSPESFYRGSVAVADSDIEQVVSNFEEDGADFIDIGAASTAPKNIYGTASVSVEEEVRRIGFAMKIITNITDLPISVDTTSSVVAEMALDMGAALINDVSGLQEDSEMAGLVASRDVPVILMASCGLPCKSVRSSLDTLKKSYKIALDEEISRKKIILDPGIGFGKETDVDCKILHNLNKFLALGQPLLVGVSRKAFIGELVGTKNPAERLTGSIAATAIAVYNGANVIRSHDIKDTKEAIRIGEAIRTRGGMNRDRMG